MPSERTTLINPPVKIIGVVLLLAIDPCAISAQGQSSLAGTNETSSANRPRVPDLVELTASFKPNEMRAVSQRYQADRGNLSRYYNVPIEPERFARFRSFGEEWLAAVERLDANALSEDARAERTRLLESVREDLHQVVGRERAQAEIAPLVPFSNMILDLDQRRRHVEKMDSRHAAGVVDDLSKRIASASKAIQEPGAPGVSSGPNANVNEAQLKRAAESVNTLRSVLKNWFNTYNDYDPLFSWWLAQPYKEADKALDKYATLLDTKSENQPATSPANDYSSASTTEAPVPTPIKLAGKTAQVPDLNELIAAPQSRMRAVIERYMGNRGGRGAFGRGGGGGRPSQSKDYYQDWLAALRKLNFHDFGREDQVNYLLLKRRIEYDLRRLDFRTDAAEDNSLFIPFQQTLEKLNETRGQQDTFEPARATEILQGLERELAEARKSATNEFEKEGAALASRAGRAARALAGMRSQLQDWHERHSAELQANAPLNALFKSADSGLDEYATFLREKSGVTSRRDGSDIAGRPIGREELNVELEKEMISYSPEELLGIAEKEFATCIAEMKRASREMGLGDDWRAAIEKVKDQYVPVGEQPYLIRDLAWEAVDYLERYDLVTIPEIARETWRLEMMSLQRQMVNPFFTGGETISVSYPVSEMSHDQKLQSMRGNNIPFSRATVFHELIPGHELQGFMAARYHPERRPFSTPFYGEGWAVYWELLLYDRGFHGSAENRIGALFWRLHRCARIIFSLNFHLERWKPQQCIDYLVAEVGHERDNATAEVRRSFGTAYGPLYQAAYLLGALQLRELNRDLTRGGKRSDRSFNDAVLKEGSMPIAMLRAALTSQPLNPDYRADWRFYDSTAQNP